jgi:DNA-binding NtrC family response regulator
VSKPAATTIPNISTRDTDTGELRAFIVGLSCEPRLVQLGHTPIVFGRDPECDVQLETGQASRRHAEVVCVGPVHVLRDLESTNGTTLNGNRIREAPLAAGSVVRMGDWLGVVTQLAEDRAAEFAFVEQAPGLWGSSALQHALRPARVAAKSELPIVIEGETGTGKELVARALHAWSGRTGALVAINCAALPEALAEGELFGYRRGAFTGAERANPGHIRSADGGTLFLDEVCELSPSLQVKLLRALEEREVVPLGESRGIPVDVRVLAAAQAPLQQAVAQQRFRADLYARLDGLTVRMPPLRERIEDVPRLIAHFMEECRSGLQARLSVNALHSACLYDWPFNVRELRQLSRRLAVLHGDEPWLHARHLPDHMRVIGEQAGATESRREAVSELDRLLCALRKHTGNVSRAARDAGISRMRAYRLMNANPELDLDDFRRGEGEAAP